MKRKITISIGVLIGLLVLRLFMAAESSPPRDDVEQITQSIEEIRQAAERGDSGAISKWIATRATVQHMQTADADRWLRRAMSNAENVRVTLSHPAIRVDGDRAVADIAHGEVSFKLFGQKHDATIKDLQLRLRLNRVHKWLFFSEQRWQIVSAEAGEMPEFSVD